MPQGRTHLFDVPIWTRRSNRALLTWSNRGIGLRRLGDRGQRIVAPVVAISYTFPSLRGICGNLKEVRDDCDAGTGAITSVSPLTRACWWQLSSTCWLNCLPPTSVRSPSTSWPQERQRRSARGARSRAVPLRCGGSYPAHPCDIGGGRGGTMDRHRCSRTPGYECPMSAHATSRPCASWRNAR